MFFYTGAVPSTLLRIKQAAPLHTFCLSLFLFNLCVSVLQRRIFDVCFLRLRSGQVWLFLIISGAFHNFKYFRHFKLFTFLFSALIFNNNSYHCLDINAEVFPLKIWMLQLVFHIRAGFVNLHEEN